MTEQEGRAASSDGELLESRPPAPTPSLAAFLTIRKSMRKKTHHQKKLTGSLSEQGFISIEERERFAPQIQPGDGDLRKPKKRKPSVSSLRELMHRVLKQVTGMGPRNNKNFHRNNPDYWSVRPTVKPKHSGGLDGGTLGRQPRLAVSSAELNTTPPPYNDKVPGLVGLANHGNTCFMNAILQCLCHTDILAEYFVMECYKGDLGRHNKHHSRKYGTSGEVTEQLAYVLKALWSMQYTPEISRHFKSVVGKYEKQYRGSNQHDAQEFLLWLLDKVHEDLYLAAKRKTKILASFSTPEEENSPHSPSFIHTHFQAKYSSSLTCPDCEQQSIKCDPFLCISIPIPQTENRTFVLSMFYRFRNPREVKITVEMSIYATVKDLKDAVSEKCDLPESQLILLELEKGNFGSIFYNSQPITCIMCCEVMACVEMPLPRKTTEQEGEHLSIIWMNRLGVGSLSERFGSVYSLQVHREIPYMDLQRTILEAMTEVLNPGILNKKLGAVLRIRVLNGIPGKSYLPDDVDHPLYMPTVDSALSIQPDILKLNVEWDYEIQQMFLSKIDEPNNSDPGEDFLNNNNQKYCVATLSECFLLYTQKEKLGPDDPWLCPNCKQLQQGVKQLSLCSVPDILIIHLKRFTQTSLQRTKLDTLVEFPLVGLDMGSHIVSNSSQSPRDECIYDLYSVCNHEGTLQSGHYTAFCKNPVDGQWYLFDDSLVKTIDESKIITSAAYLLFYQRRSLCSRSVTSQQHWVYRMPPFAYSPPKTSKSQDNLYDIDSSSTFMRGTRAYTSMMSLSAYRQEPDESKYHCMVLPESCV